MQKVNLLISFLFIGLLATAQTFDKGTIKGTVVDENKAGLPYATILLKNGKDSAIHKSTLSNKQGAFVFDVLPVGSYFIEISMVGYDKQIKSGIAIDSNNSVTDLGTIEVVQAAKVLREVTVKAQVPFVERQIDRTVVNIENSIVSVGLNVLEMLQKLPGVQVSQDGQVTLNGKSAVTVFIDGKPTYLSADDLANLLRGMSSSNIQKVEIMTKPSAKFDAAGSGGIINIVKKRNHKEGLNGNINGGAGLGYYGKYNGGFNMNYKAKGYNLVMNMAYVYNKTFLATKITSDILNDDQSLRTEQVADNKNIRTTKAYTPTVGIEFHPLKRTSLTLSGTAGFQRYNTRTTSLMNELDNNKVKTGALDFINKITDKPVNYTTNLHLIHQVDTFGKEIIADLDYSNYVNKTIQDINNLYYDAGGNFTDQSNFVLDQVRHLDIYAAKVDYSQPLKNNGHLEIGLKSSYVKANNDNKYYDIISNVKNIDSSQSDYTINDENINAAYINLNKQFGKKITIQAGIRAEHTRNKGEQLFNGQLVRQNYFQLFPSVFLDYKINDDNGLTIRLAKRVDRVAYSQLNPFRRPLSPTLYFQGNPNLKPQLSYNSEISYSFQNALFITIGFDFFKDYIGTLPFLDSNKITVSRIPSNIKGAHFYNLAITYSKKILPWWTVNYNLSAYKQAFNGSVGDFGLQNSGLLAYDFDLNNNFAINNKLSAECNFNFVSRHRIIATTYSGYHVLILGLKHLLFKERGTIAANFINVFQSEDESSLYQYRNLNQYWDVNFYTRSVNLSFTYRFGKGKTTMIRSGSGSLEEQKRTKM